MDKHCTQNIKEAVCIETNKVYDSCKDKECLENLRVHFCEGAQHIIDRAVGVKLRRVEIIWVQSDVESLTFNKGFFSVDIKFFFKVCLEVCGVPGARGVDVEGICTYCKKVILFGSEGSAFIFSSTFRPNADDIAGPRRTNLPKAVVEIVEPVALGAKLVEACCDCDDCCDDEVLNIPECICALFDSGFNGHDAKKHVFVTIGIFVIVKLVRTVQLLIPCYDFCVPDKGCTDASDDDPCSMFAKFRFPINEFCPPPNCNEDDGCC